MSEQPTFPPLPPIPPSPHFYERSKKRTRWWIPIIIIVGIVGIFFATIIGFVVYLGNQVNSADKTVTVQTNTVLLFTLKEPLDEFAETNPFEFLGAKKSVGFLDVLTAIRRAGADDNIKGMYLKGSVGAMGSAKAMELLEVLRDFKKKGKFIYSYAESYDEKNYFIASVADSVFMPQQGMLELNGFAISSMFFKGLFDKIGMKYHVEQFEEYKSFGETFNREQFSGPAREELQAILNQRWKLFTEAVAINRSISSEEVASSLRSGVYSADTAKARKLVDGFAYAEGVTEKIKSRLFGHDTKGKSLKLVSVADYSLSVSGKLKDQKLDEDHEIAIIYASGTILSGKKKGSNPGVYSTSFIADLKSAREDADIDGIILRIDSPGGSALASDEMWEEIQKTRKVKPVYASMSDVAASGGYYMAVACDTIIASPATITGSIGVIMAIPNFSGTLSKVGVTTDTVSTNQAAKDIDLTRPFTDRDRSLFHLFGNNTYQRFLSRVAEGRKKTTEEIRKVARGRVWTGEAAKDHDLVDELGGIQTSIAMMKKRVGVKENMKVRIRTFPEKQDGVKAFLNLLGIEEDEAKEESDEAMVRLTVLRNLFGVNSALPYQEFLSALPPNERYQFQLALDFVLMTKDNRVLTFMPFPIQNL